MDKITDKLDELTPDLDNIDTVMPQLLALLPPQIATMESVRTMLLTTYSTMSGIIEQMEELGGDAAAMGQDFDAAQNDDSFYLPRGVFDNPDFQRVMKLFLSPDGKAARFIITHRENPATVEGIARIDAIKTAAEESLKGTPLANAKIYVAGTAAIFKDLREGSNYDLVDRRDCSALHHFHHHVVHHAKSYSCPGDRGYRSGCLWAHRLGYPCWSGSIFSASTCTGSCC